MVNHIKYHLGDLPHLCPFCDKRFPNTRELNRHKLTHSNKNRKNQKVSILPIVYENSNRNMTEELKIN